MAKDGYNCSEISQHIGETRQTVQYWKNKYKIDIQNYGSREGYLKYKMFLSILEKALSKNEFIRLNEVLRKIDLHPGTAQNILKKNPHYRAVIRDKIEALSQVKVEAISHYNIRYQIDDLKKYAHNKGGHCLSDSYVNNNTKYTWQCSEKHEWNATWSDVKNGNKWCPTCGRKSASEKLKRYTIDNLKQYAQKIGGRCLSDTYVSYNTKYIWQCSEKHEWNATWSDVKSSKKWCMQCGHKNIGDKNRKYSIEDLKTHAISKEGKCLSHTYDNCLESYEWQCKKDHKWQASWDSINRGTWCPYCTSQHSKAEQEILDWVKQWYPNSHSTRQIIKPKEIDIYIPELKIGIEYCGLYWHNEKSPQPRDRNYHKNKMLQCQEQGIRLLTIFEDEWTNRQKQVKNFIKSVIGIHSKRVYARKCEIKEVENSVAHRFLDDNHIQGKTSIKIAFGLFYENELLGLVTGNKHHRNFEGKNEFVLNRLVFGDEVQVVGGASKLIQHLCKYAKEQGFNRLISWSDNRYSEGNVYEKCGFIIEDTVPPDYSYVTPDLRRESKQSNKKALLLKKGAVGNMSMTEIQLADTLGYARIWDCGKKKFAINL